MDETITVIEAAYTSARTRAIARFGKEAEDLIYIKFNKDGGAAAEILNYFGEEGISVLNKVSNIQEAPRLLTQDKILYRYINESSFGFNDMKTTGIINEAPPQYPIYVTSERYTSGASIKDKFQLPGTNEPSWVVEFDANQMADNIKFANGKWNQQEYIEVLCKSFPNQGSGGGLQYITFSKIKLKKMTNLKTGEVITFNY